MQRSTDRFLTTHVGSLPRPPEILELVLGKDQREVSANPAARPRIQVAVHAAVARQIDIGLDVPNDGEQGRVGFSSYATERLTGFDGPPRPMVMQVERSLFPEFYASVGPPLLEFPTCNGPIRWVGDAAIARDIEIFKTALASLPAPPIEAFMTAVSPGQLWLNFRNEHYPSDEAYIFAAAEALHHEYKAIVDAGLILQLDDPSLAMGWNRQEFADKTFDDYRRLVEQHVEAINVALQGIPPDRVRLHVCWGNNETPHVRDIPLAELVDILYGVNAHGLSVEGANPRHGYEWQVFKSHPLPDGKVLLPGLIDTVTNFVEHPRLVADRLGRFASVVGKENVVASADCGFGTFVRAQPRVHPTIAWAKLQSLAEGAKLASDELF